MAGKNKDIKALLAKLIAGEDPGDLGLLDPDDDDDAWETDDGDLDDDGIEDDDEAEEEERAEEQRGKS